MPYSFDPDTELWWAWAENAYGEKGEALALLKDLILEYEARENYDTNF